MFLIIHIWINNALTPCTSYGEFMTLFSKTVAERTRPGQRQDVEEQGMEYLFPYLGPLANFRRPHFPCLWSHRRGRWCYHLRPWLSSPRCPSAALQSRWRVPLKVSSIRICKFEPDIAVSRIERLHCQVSRPATSRQHHEDSKGTGRDEDCVAQNDWERFTERGENRWLGSKEWWIECTEQNVLQWVTYVSDALGQRHWQPFSASQEAELVLYTDVDIF